MDKEQIEEFNKALHKKDRNWKNLGVTEYTPIGNPINNIGKTMRLVEILSKVLFQDDCIIYAYIQSLYR